MWGTIKVLALILRGGSTEYKHVQEGGTDKPGGGETNGNTNMMDLRTHKPMDRHSPLYNRV